MPLTWRPAFDAASYRVCLGAVADSLALLGETRTTSFTPSGQLAVTSAYSGIVVQGGKLVLKR